MTFTAVFQSDPTFAVTFEGDQTFTAGFDTVVEVQGDVFEGPYEYTPSAEEQIIEVERLNMAENIVINPIPNNYGLITWNGSTITVS